jgi:hypothetical protein
MKSEQAVLPNPCLDEEENLNIRNWDGWMDGWMDG